LQKKKKKNYQYKYPVKADTKHNNIETFKEDSKTLKNDFDNFDMIDNEIENSFIEKIEKIKSEEPKRSYSQMDDESITVEFLGEIESIKESEAKKRTERVKEYIAPAVNLNDYKKSMNKEIRDAIPVVRNKR
jgi:hypothetical protein